MELAQGCSNKQGAQIERNPGLSSSSTMFFGAYWAAGRRGSQSSLLNNDLLEPVSQHSKKFSTKISLKEPQRVGPRGPSAFRESSKPGRHCVGQVPKMSFSNCLDIRNTKKFLKPNNTC